MQGARLEFRASVDEFRNFRAKSARKHKTTWGTKIYSYSGLYLKYTIKLLKNQEVTINITDGKYGERKPR